tara:strand:- start:866 stop:1264 length:399 start_codon:yes stop_codon:yes gene_type:complete
MTIHMQKLIKTSDVPAALDRAMSAIAALRAQYTAERSDAGSNETGDVAYLNAAHDCLLITRQLQHDMLKAASDVIGQPVSSFDIPTIMEMEGVDVEILSELREMLAYQSEYTGSDYRPSNTDHLRVAGGRLV